MCTLRREIVPCSYSNNPPSLDPSLLSSFTCSFMCVWLYSQHLEQCLSHVIGTWQIFNLWILLFIHSFTYQTLCNIFFILDILLAPKYVNMCLKKLQFKWYSNYSVRRVRSGLCVQGRTLKSDNGEEKYRGERWESVRSSLSWEFKENHRPHKCP